MPERIEPDVVRFRRPTENDYPMIAAAAESWFDDRRPGELVGRLWFRHFTESCWLAEDRADGTLVGFLAGFRSASHADTVVLQAVGVHAGHRRRGIGRGLVERFVDDARASGAGRIEAVCWPGNRRALRFLVALAFEPDPASGTHMLFGTPAFEGYDFGTEDRTRLIRELRRG